MAGSRAPAAGMRSRNSSRGCTGWPRRRGATPRRCPPRCSAPRRKKGRCANTRTPASTARCSRSRTRAPTRSCASSTATSRCSLDRDGSVGWVERSETHPRFRGHVMRLSILDDYQGVALEMADWAPVRARGIEIAVERFPFADAEDVVRSLADSEIVAAMRERTAFPKSIVDRLAKLKLLITTGMRNASFDMAALRDRGVTVCGTGGPGGGNEDTAELDPRQHLARTDLRYGCGHRGAEGKPARLCRSRCLRPGAVAAQSPAADRAERHPDAAYRLRDRGELPQLLPADRREHPRLSRRQADPGDLTARECEAPITRSARRATRTLPRSPRFMGITCCTASHRSRKCRRASRKLPAAAATSWRAACRISSPSAKDGSSAIAMPVRSVPVLATATRSRTRSISMPAKWGAGSAAGCSRP